jgi:putative NADH-flavin reductase
MPVVVIGADTPLGNPIIQALLARRGQVRALVSDPGAAARFKELGVKVAVGDLSDSSLVQLVSRGAFSAVLVAEAAFDGRELAFAADPTALAAAWGEGLNRAGVRRAIWVQDQRAEGLEREIGAGLPEAATVTTQGRTPAEVAGEVAALDDLAELDPDD